MSVARANSLPARAHPRMAEIVTAGTLPSRTRLSRYRCCAVGPGAIAATRARSGPQVPVRHEVLGLALSKTTTVTAGDSSIRVTRRASCSMEPASIRFTSPFSKVTFQYEGETSSTTNRAGGSARCCHSSIAGLADCVRASRNPGSQRRRAGTTIAPRNSLAIALGDRARQSSRRRRCGAGSE